MTSKILLQLMGVSVGICWTALAHGQTTVTIDGSTTFQTLRGWGGNTYGWTLNEWNGWENDKVYEVAFNELGTTHLRLVSEFECWEPENDDGDPNHFNWAYYESRFQQADTKGLLVQSDFNMMHMITNSFRKQLLIGIWNVPDWMVSDPAKKDHRRLPRTRYAEFAESVAAYLLWARARRGVEIREIVLANEPDGTYLEYSPEELREVIKTVGAKFAREGLATKIVAPDLASPYFDPDLWITTLLADSVAASYLSAISYHTYYVEDNPDVWNAKFARIAELAARKKLEVYYTEIGTTPWNIPNTSWPWAFDCAQRWHNALTWGNASLGYQWALLGRDYVVNPDASRNPIFYVLAQFFQHIPVGAVRVAAHASHRDLLVSAFHHAETQRAQVIFINRAAMNLEVNVDSNNLPLQTLEAYRTSQSEKHIRVAVEQIVGQHFRLYLPSFSITTVTGTTATRQDSIPPAPPQEVIIKEN